MISIADQNIWNTSLVEALKMKSEFQSSATIGHMHTQTSNKVIFTSCVKGVFSFDNSDLGYSWKLLRVQTVELEF